MSRAAYCHLRAIGRIRKHLHLQSTKQFVHSLVISRLDDCNSLLYGLPDTLLAAAACTECMCQDGHEVFQTWPYNTTMKELHWLLVHARIEYKTIFLIFKFGSCLSGRPNNTLLSSTITPFSVQSTACGTFFRHETLQKQVVSLCLCRSSAMEQASRTHATDRQHCTFQNSF